jgi:hypothetical protein
VCIKIIAGRGKNGLFVQALYKKISFSYDLMAEKYIKKYKYWLTSRSSRPV